MPDFAGMYDDEEWTAESESVSSDENSLHSCDEDLEDSDVGVKTTRAKLEAMYPVLMRDKVQTPGNNNSALSLSSSNTYQPKKLSACEAIIDDII